MGCTETKSCEPNRTSKPKSQTEDQQKQHENIVTNIPPKSQNVGLEKKPESSVTNTPPNNPQKVDEFNKLMPQLSVISNNSALKKYHSTDNQGTFYETALQVDNMWSSIATQPKSPYLFYDHFPSQKDAILALLELDDIFKIAEDTNNIISLRTIQYGVYQDNNKFACEKYELFVYGRDFSEGEWKKLAASCEKHGGKYKNGLKAEEADYKPTRMDNEKQKQNQKNDSEKKDQAENEDIESKVKFKEIEYNDSRTYEVYTAENLEIAKKFLMNRCVSRKLLYIVVETPQGNLGKDINGIYEEEKAVNPTYYYKY